MITSNKCSVGWCDYPLGFGDKLFCPDCRVRWQSTSFAYDLYIHPNDIGILFKRFIRGEFLL